MTPAVVVDIGNTRMKWGVCHAGRITSTVSLDADDPGSWERSVPMGIGRGSHWAVSSVHPTRLAQLQSWADERGITLHLIRTYQQLPLLIHVDYPERVGIDRLLNAVAANRYLPARTPGVLVDVGTAVTIDWVDTEHIFQGGAILPGPRLMFEVMHQHTAKLPPIPTHEIPTATAPGKNTHDAMTVGVMAAQVGAVEFLIREYVARFTVKPWLILTGGAVGSLASHSFVGVEKVVHDPLMTLSGIRIAAESLS